MERVSNWESILAEKLLEPVKFEYGKLDCTIWSINIIKAYTNLEWEAFWTNKFGALRAQLTKGIKERVSDSLGAPINNIINTQRGDLVQKGLGIDAALGICIGAQVVFLYESLGICYVDLKDCTYSWRI